MGLYESSLEKWKEFLPIVITAYLHKDEITSDEATELYDGLGDEFCEEYGYKPRTKEIIFHTWYDTFADEFYLQLERENITINSKGLRTNPK